MARIDTGPLEGLILPAVGESEVAFTRANIVLKDRLDDRDGLLAVDRDTFETRGYLPVPDDHDYYAQMEELRPVAWLDDDTLAFTVLPKDAPKEYLLTWNVETGELSRISCWLLDTGRVRHRSARTMKTLAVAALLVALTGCTTDPPSAEPPTETPATSDPPSQTPEAEPRWDPRDVDDLPAGGPEVAGLPAVVEPPDVAPLLETKPMSAAVLSVDRRGGRIQLLGVDGSWREVELPNEDGRLALSRRGALARWHPPRGPARRRHRALAPADRRPDHLPLPAGFEPWDYSWIDWVDDDALLLDDLKGGWRVDTITGTADEVPYPIGMSFGWTVDDRGAVVEVDDPSEGNALTDWGGGVRRQIDMSPTGRLSSIQARSDTIAGTSYERDGFAVYVADRLDLSPRDILPRA